MQKAGKFIVLEGVDGSGLSTQVALLRSWMEENRPLFGKTYFTKEPTDGPVGSVIRLALSKRLKPLDERVMALLFAADRLDHLYCAGENGQKEGLVTLLNKGCNVVSDRYYLSSFAYQALNVDLNWVRQLNSFSIKPDLTILLQVSAEESNKRRNNSRIHEELYESRELLSAVSRNYEEIALQLKSEGENIVLIDGRREIREVFAAVKAAVRQLFE